MRCLLFANGIIQDPSYLKEALETDDIIISLDGGLQYIEQMKLLPHFLIGDFDSVDEKLLRKYIAAGCEIIKYPERKDFTDMELGIGFAVSKGAQEIILIGALGGRTDHLLANVHGMIQSVTKGIKTWIFGEREDIFLINDEIELWYKKGTVLSLLPLSQEVKGITTYNLDYPLKKETLFMGCSRGISNVIKDEWAKVSISSGLLIVAVNKNM